MGAYLSVEDESIPHIACPEICDEETWENTLRNRSSFTVSDHLEIMAVNNQLFQEDDCMSQQNDILTKPPATPPESPRRRLGFAASTHVIVYDVTSPPSEIGLKLSENDAESESDDDLALELLAAFI